MKKIIALAICAILVLALFAGCSDSNKGSDNAVTAENAQAAYAEYTDMLSFSMWSLVLVNDPVYGEDSFTAEEYIARDESAGGDRRHNGPFGWSLQGNTWIEFIEGGKEGVIPSGSSNPMWFEVISPKADEQNFDLVLRSKISNIAYGLKFISQTEFYISALNSSEDVKFFYKKSNDESNSLSSYIVGSWESHVSSIIFRDDGTGVMYGDNDDGGCQFTYTLSGDILTYGEYSFTVKTGTGGYIDGEDVAHAGGIEGVDTLVLYLEGSIAGVYWRTD